MAPPSLLSALGAATLLQQPCRLTHVFWQPCCCGNDSSHCLWMPETAQGPHPPPLMWSSVILAM